MKQIHIAFVLTMIGWIGFVQIWKNFHAGCVSIYQSFLKFWKAEYIYGLSVEKIDKKYKYLLNFSILLQF